MNGLDGRVTQLNSTLDEEKCSAQVSEPNVASLHVLLYFLLDLLVKLKDRALLTLTDAADVFVGERLGVPINNVPKICLIFKLCHVDLSQFTAKRDWQLLLARRGVGWIHAHKNAEVFVALSFNYISSFVQENMASLHDCGQLV